MIYKVVRKFADLDDGGHIYEVGEEYPRPDILEVSDERIKELATSANMIGKPLIEPVPLWTQISYDNAENTDGETNTQPAKEKAVTATKKPRKGTKKEGDNATTA